MATLTIRNLDEGTRRVPQPRAARRGPSTRQGARTVPGNAVGRDEPARASRETGEKLFAAARRLVEPHGGFAPEVPPRSGDVREPRKFE